MVPECETVYLDLETTGLYPPADEVLEVAIVDAQGQVLLESLVRPEHTTAWPEAEAIHGIAPGSVQDAPTLEGLRSLIRAAVCGKTLVIYNAPFDLGFLPDELAQAAAVHCCMRAFAEHYGEWSAYHGTYRWQTLSTAADYVRYRGIAGAHRARADALACRAVWRYLTVPAERARVEALRTEEHATEEARWILRREDHERAAAQQQEAARLGRWWLAWWLRTQELPLRQVHYGEGAIRADDYALLFTGYTNAVLEQIAWAEARGLRRLAHWKDRPPYLTTASGVATVALPTGWEAPLVAYYITKSGKQVRLLYDTRRRRLRKQLPQIEYGPIPDGYGTASQLHKRGLSQQQIARRKIRGYWRKPYTREWLALYALPSHGAETVGARPRERWSDETRWRAGFPAVQ
jgi:DNA polymerase III epsilon subunit-like protein